MDSDWDSVKKFKKILATGLLFIMAGLIATSVLYITRLKKILNQEADRYLTENSLILTEYMKYHFQSNQRYLQTVASSLPEQNDYWSNENYEYLRRVVRNSAIINMGIATKEGKLKTISNEEMDISNNPVFQKAMTGESVVDAQWDENQYGDGYIIYYSPIVQNRNTMGALVAYYSMQHIQMALDMKRFGDQGYSYIINQENLESLDISPDMITYQMPMGIADWYLVSAIPKQVVTEQTNSLIIFSIVINISMLTVLMLVCGLVYYMQRGLERQLFMDSITGGPNGAWFAKEVKGLLKDAKAKEYAMVSIDVGHFKLINDSFGANKGNLVLRYILNKMQCHLHPDERVVRMTEDNFYMFMKYVDNEDILVRLEELIQDINSYNYKSEVVYYLNFAIGVFIIDDTSMEIISLQDRADVARKNKDKHILSYGGSCVFYTETERQRMMEEKDITNCMDKALYKKEFVVYLQPKFELAGSTVAGAEALVRWMHPQYGLVSPATFIPVFENNGFIIKLDLYVFEEVCRKLREWIDIGIQPVPISVNLSRVHLNNDRFMEQYQMIFQKYHLPPSLIEIELTETMIFENMEKLIAVIDEIHDAGFSCALDDFGSGYSSLNMLREAHVDVLKLDKAFFDETHGTVVTNERGQFVVKAVVDLAKKLNMKTVCEGVETYSQVDILKRMDCDMIQGYVFSKPIGIDEFEKLAYGI